MRENAGHERPLLELVPTLRDRWVQLLNAPTPVRRLAGLGEACGHDRLWLKDDRYSNDLCGGSKARKLEFLLGDATRLGAGTVVTFGATGGTHALATAMLGGRLAFRVVVFVNRQSLKSGSIAHQNFSLLRRAGALRFQVPLVVRLMVEKILLAVLRNSDFLCHSVYVIPTGGTNALGCLGSLNGILELHRQLGEIGGRFPDEIYVAAGSCGTAVGLALGVQLLGVQCRIKAVPIASSYFVSAKRMEMLSRQTWILLGSLGLEQVTLGRPSLDLVRGFEGTGYGVPSEEGKAALRELTNLERLELDETYTAKAMAAFIQRSSEAEVRESSLLFWNTCRGGLHVTGTGEAPPLDPANS